MNSEYVLVTTAYNEEANVERTLSSVICQTQLPKRWIIVSDGSIDKTDKILRSYSCRHSFISFVRRERGREGYTKPKAFELGYRLLADCDYDFVGSLDADLSFDSHYFETLLKYFARCPELGIAGGRILDFHNGSFKPRPNDQESHVPGGIQFFRRACFEAIGGLMPLEYGGEDTIADVMARMKGWQVRSFSDLPVSHHRQSGGAVTNVLSRRFRLGIHDYSIGTSRIYFLAKSIYHLKEEPFVLGSFLRMLGFCWGAVTRVRKPIPPEVVAYRHDEQRARLNAEFRSILTRAKIEFRNPQ